MFSLVDVSYLKKQEFDFGLTLVNFAGSISYNRVSGCTGTSLTSRSVLIQQQASVLVPDTEPTTSLYIANCKNLTLTILLNRHTLTYLGKTGYKTG